MLNQRVITALVLGGVFLVVLLALPPVFFQLFMVLVFAIGSWEWSNLAGVSSLVARAAFSLAMLLLLAGVWFDPFGLDLLMPILTVAVCWWGIALLWVQGYPSSSVFWQSPVARLVIGLFVLIPTAVALLHLHSMPNGEWLIVALLVVVSCADSGAYFSGRAFGKRKLAPKVSPGKSWEGVVGGFVLVACVAAAFGGFYQGAVGAVLIVALPAAAISVLGDLLESMLKRHRGIKDSGSILPGHGGVLDRIDGVTSAAPVFALAVSATGWVIS